MYTISLTHLRSISSLPWNAGVSSTEFGHIVSLCCPGVSTLAQMFSFALLHTLVPRELVYTKLYTLRITSERFRP